MLDTKKDVLLTKQLYKTGIFESRYSWISNAGHVYLRRADKENLREILAIKQNHRCAICGERIAVGFDDLDHIQGGSQYWRCDCYGQRLTDGSVCTNVQMVHGMFSHKPCHRNKHNREVKWSPKNS